MQEDMGKPLARSQGLVVEELGDELLVYDLDSDHAHSLGATAAEVWRRCDGKTPAGALGTELDLDRDTIDRALEELAASNLLEAAAKPVDGSTRRELTVKMVKVGAAVAAAPLIISVAAPPAWAALTPGQCLALTDFSGNCGSSTGCTAPGTGCCCCNPQCGVQNCPTCPPGAPSGTKWCAAGVSACQTACGSNKAGCTGG
jgi:Coenzyme PQQ synthesis protein D (PqqD)